MSRQVEVERKFAAEPDALLPALPGIAEVDATRDLQLVAVYFDTPRFALSHAGITLRRRTGGTDDGWHLKVPADGPHRRVEIHVELTDSRSPLLVPEALRAEVDTVAKGRPLIPVAELRTHRIERDLTAVPGGPVLGVLSDDTVSAAVGPPIGPLAHRWREWEIEQVTGTDAWLAQVADALLETPGVAPSRDSSKLAHALGDLPDPVTPSPDMAARDVLLGWFATQVGVLQSRAGDIRQNTGDAVHKSRVATRRLRSILRTFADLLDRDITDRLRGELKWYAAALGGARDAEVVKARLVAAALELPDEVRTERFLAHLNGELTRTHDHALDEAIAAIDSPRYVGLQQDLVRLLTEPPFGPDADRAAHEVLRKPVDRARRKVLTWHRRALDAQGPEQTTAQHETRKKAKAMRYACEALEDAFPPADAAASAWEQVTERLGLVQDAAVARERLSALATGTPAEVAFAYGVLYGRELRNADQDAQDAAEAVVAADQPEHRRWLRD